MEITWGHYLTWGLGGPKNPPSFDAELLLTRGWCLIDSETFDESLFGWQEIFRLAFSQTTEEKINSGDFRVEKGVTVGYKCEENVGREFFETRLKVSANDDIVTEPNILTPKFGATVKSLFKFYSALSFSIISKISRSILFQNEMFLLDLTDIGPRLGTSQNYLRIENDEYSSSLLRICSYPPATDQISFGAHTDTSFITLGLCSASPGLEVLDQLTGEWLEVEKMAKSPGSVVVLAGEFLEVMTQHKFKATVHRVRSPPISSPISSSMSRTRISCPFLVRGRHKAVIQGKAAYIHPSPGHLSGGDAVSAEYIPDLEGTRWRAVHQLLDLKRQRCARANMRDGGGGGVNRSGSAEADDWVLGAFQ